MPLPPVGESPGGLRADIFGKCTAGVETAARRRIDRIGRIAGDRRLVRAVVGIERGHRGKQRFRVGMPGLRPHRLDRSALDYFSEIHHDDAVADEADHVKVVRDKDISETEFLLQIDQQIEHLRLDRLIEGGNGFVENDQARRQSERAGDINPLLLSAGQFMRIAAREHCPDRVRLCAEIHARCSRAALAAKPCTLWSERDVSSIVSLGLSEA